MKPGVPPAFTKKGAGRVIINDAGLVLAASNITPDGETGAGSWTDDQLARASREGIGHDDRTLYPMMPYQEYLYPSDEDLASIIMYIRSLEPVRNELPKRQIPFPLSRLINTAPEPLAGPEVAEVSDPVSRAQSIRKTAHRCVCYIHAQGAQKRLTCVGCRESNRCV